MTAAQHQSYATLLHEVQPRPIRTKAEYRKQIEWLEYLMGLPPTRDTSTMIEMLSLTLGAHEAEQFPISDASPALVLDHLIEHSGRTSTAIARALGISPTTLSNYRCGRRKLTTDRIVQLAQYFAVVPAVFLGSEGGSLETADQKRPSPRTQAGRKILDEEVLDALDHLGGTMVSAAQIRKLLGVNPVQLRSSLNRLIERGEVSFTGKARATRYGRVGSEHQQASATPRRR